MKIKKEGNYAGFLKKVFPSAWHTNSQSSLIASSISSWVAHTTGIHDKSYSSNRLM